MAPEELHHSAADAGSGSGRRRGVALGLIVCAVVLVHAWITQGVMDHLETLEQDQASAIERMEATLVADMQLAEPPVVTAPPPSSDTPEPIVAAVQALASAASQPASKVSAPSVEDAASNAALASTPASASDLAEASVAPSTPLEEASGMAAAAASAPSSPTSSAAVADAANAAPAFEWPLATRVTFKLEGYVRGPVYGNAMVEWVRQDQRYQVHVDASIGPSFAPLGSQRWTSEGLITPRGLQPQRFEAVNKLLIKSNRPRVVGFEDTELVLADGKRLPIMQGVQDPASHYIQMAYEFMLDPTRLKVGNTMSLPLARTQHQEMVIYDILAQEVLDTPLGKVETFRMRPRPLTEQKNDLLGELWIAPSLQYLPIRMLVRQGEKNFLDMKMDRAPQQASAVAPSPSDPR